MNADHIAIASATGLVTTKLNDGEFGRRWWVTPKGLKALWTSEKRRA